MTFCRSEKDLVTLFSSFHLLEPAEVVRISLYILLAFCVSVW